MDVQATDYSGNTRTSTYQVTVSGATKSFTHDPNGNMTGDGTRTFEWDAENRLTAVNNGTHRSEFSYDGLSRRIRIVEKENCSPVNCSSGCPKSGFRGSGCRICAGFRISAHSPIEKPRSIFLCLLRDLQIPISCMKLTA